MYHLPAGSPCGLKIGFSGPIVTLGAPGAHKEGKGVLKMKIAMRKASNLVALTTELYRELTLSALRLLPGRF